MSDTLPPCPQCGSEYTYEMDPLLVCPECAHEWSPATDADASTPADGPRVVTDANGTPLADGDSVTVLKSLKVKGFPQAIKPGTKVKNIRLVDGVDGHDIDCKVDGFGQMQLKSSVVRKA